MSRKTRRSIVLLLAVLFVPGAAGAEDVVIFAKDYIDSHDIGLEPIGVRSGWLVGLDYPGEWTEYQFSLSGFGTNRAELHAMGQLGIQFHIRIILTGAQSGNEQRVDFIFYGRGFSG